MDVSQQKITMTKYPNNPTAQLLGVLSTIYDLWFKLTRVWSLLVLSPKAKGRPNKWFVSWLSGRKTYLTESYFKMCGIQVYFPKRSKSNIYSYLLYIYINIQQVCIYIFIETNTIPMCFSFWCPTNGTWTTNICRKKLCIVACPCCTWRRAYS